ncbi:ATP-binding cassette domain-containing protein [Nonomuraea sp. NPDC059194]|uniref:ATP-binding cassette domain-containing protein n=1 Tax=Nonomuraea sp. NPDC059194 TaxID=3346764 RepID=UPI0036C1C20E
MDCAVARGSIFALLGSNGSSKTTIMKILSTLLKADAGTASTSPRNRRTCGSRSA